jgi:hypothetical protein
MESRSEASPTPLRFFEGRGSLGYSSYFHCARSIARFHSSWVFSTFSSLR